MSSTINRKINANSKTKKDLFEEQLKTLQLDISNLSLKINPNSTNGFKSNNGVKDISQLSLDKIVAPVVEITSKNSAISSNEVVFLNNELARYKQLVETLSKEKEDAIFREDLLQKEIDELRSSLRESQHHQATIDHYKQDNESLKISLESSERIRKQQKELIYLLQRSHALGDNGSITSINSISTIQHRDDSTVVSMTPSVVAAENRSWLNSYQKSSTSKPINENNTIHFKNPPPLTSLSLGIAESTKAIETNNKSSNGQIVNNQSNYHSTIDLSARSSPSTNNENSQSSKTKKAAKKKSIVNSIVELTARPNKRSDIIVSQLTGKPPKFPVRTNSLSTNSIRNVRFANSPVVDSRPNRSSKPFVNNQTNKQPTSRVVK